MHRLGGFSHRAHEPGNDLGSFRQYRTSSRDRGSGKGNRLIRPIDNIAKSLRDSFGVRRRQQRRSIDPAGKQRAQRFGVAPGLDKKDILFRIHPSATEGLDAEIMRIAADPRDTDFFAFQLLQIGYLRFGENALVMKFLMLPINTKSVAPLTKAFTTPIPPSKPTSTLPPSRAAVAVEEEGM
jgi:hypothetical protein